VGLVGPEYCRALASVAARGDDVSAAVAGADAANLWEKVKVNPEIQKIPRTLNPEPEILNPNAKPTP
jgi:hypothetical protein